MRVDVLGLAIGVFSFVAQANAQTFVLPPGTEAITAIAGKITAVEPRRVPLGSATTGSETQITLQFTLAGCLDTLLPLLTQSEIKGQRATVYVTALNAHNQASKTARCVAIPQASAQIKIPGVFQRNQIRVVFMEQDAVTQSQTPAPTYKK